MGSEICHIKQTTKNSAQNQMQCGLVAGSRPSERLVDVTHRPDATFEHLHTRPRLVDPPANHTGRGLRELGLFR